MAIESINEPIEVLASFRLAKGGSALVKPEIINWAGRRYKVDQLGLRYPTQTGVRTVHVFTVLCKDTAMELEFDSHALTWKLRKISDGNPS
jgi:hypothetical protein